jgi:hypothetical protein
MQMQEIRMFRTVALTFAFALGLSGAVGAGPGDTQAALGACATAFPDAAGVAKALRGAGFADRGDMAGLRMFVSADGTTVAGTKGSAATGLRCLVMEHKQSAKKAEALAAALVRRMPGASKLQPPAKEVSVLYSGMLNNKMANVFVARSFGFGKIAGAALLVEMQ